MQTDNKKGARLLEQPDTKEVAALQKTTTKIISHQRAKRKWRRRVYRSIDRLALVIVGLGLFLAGCAVAENGSLLDTLLAGSMIASLAWLLQRRVIWLEVE